MDLKNVPRSDTFANCGLPLELQRAAGAVQAFKNANHRRDGDSTEDRLIREANQVDPRDIANLTRLYNAVRAGIIDRLEHDDKGDVDPVMGALATMLATALACHALDAAA